MSLYAMDSAVDPNILSNQVFENPKSQSCLTPMGITSENVTEAYKISRERQDQFAVESHLKAAKAIKEGLL